MANTFLETIGDVDVISDAENIKRILKLPYNPKSVISMVIHRVNNTLLIDEFDIHKFLLRQTTEDWAWLKTFILNCMSEQERQIFLRRKGVSRELLQNLNLQSKFLYYSVENASDNDPSHDNLKQALSFMKQKQRAALNVIGPRLPDPKEGENLPKIGANYQHNRNLIWTFEDIKMLIGTDVPIFGNANRPVITLRLRDMTKPINVLTGIDYWLDNLMCNVPEVLMCYHLDGMVQKYELIKTEDLPEFSEASKFSPRLIRNVAQSILAFLKANATKPGHTYWLYKGKHDDVVKLYDLSTLCKEEVGDKNPFIVPVAMLLYTVAKNIRNTQEKLSPKTAGRVKSLLENCLKLLPPDKHPQIVTSCHYMLADLFIPSYIDPKCPDFSCNNTDDSESDEEDENFENDSDAPSTTPPEGELVNLPGDIVTHLQKNIKEASTVEQKHGKYNSSPPPLCSEDVLERCAIALNHVASGLESVQYITSSEEEKFKEEERQKRISEEQNQNMANPSCPIPLPYETLSKNGKKKLGKQMSSDSGTTTNGKDEQSLLPLASTGVIKSWNTHLKLIHFEKACLVYVTKGEHAYSNECYGVALKYFYNALKCHLLIGAHLPALNDTDRSSCLLGRIADCYYQLSQHADQLKQHLASFESESDVDQMILQEISKDVGVQIESNLPKPSSEVDELLQTCCVFYEMAIEGTESESKHEHMRRLASVLNDLGNRYMLRGQEEYNDYLTKSETNQNQETIMTPSYQTNLLKAFDSFNRAIKLLETVKDTKNLILILNNMGRFMRLRAHVALPGEIQNDVNIIKKFYNGAFDYYNRALTELESRKQNPDLWELVAWELSSATFYYANALQDHTPASSRITVEELEQLVIDALQKALKLCDMTTPGSHQVLYTFRAGLIYNRLGSFYHNNYRNCDDENRRRKLLHLCRIHYEKSSKIFSSLKEPREFLDVQLKHISLLEELVENSVKPVKKLEQLKILLSLFLEAHTLMETIQKASKDDADLLKLLILFEQRLQLCTKNFVKVSIEKKNDKNGPVYKNMYASCLRPQKQGITCTELAQSLQSALEKIKKFISELK